jgi:peptidoglycan-N-acetylglucosamine deacetylase
MRNLRSPFHPAKMPLVALGAVLAASLMAVRVQGRDGPQATGYNKLPAGPQGTDSPLPASWLVWQTALQKAERLQLGEPAHGRPVAARGPYRSLLVHGPYDRREVALTFDDGPHPTFTPRLLALLRRYRVRATFLVVGQQARAYPRLIAQEIADGHAVGNHTYHHANLTETSQLDLLAEILACGDVLRAITGKQPHLFRPPGGRYNHRVTSAARALGYTTVLWTDNSHDYLNPGLNQLEHRVVRGIGNGEIILMHDGARQTLEVLPQVLEHLKATGRKCVTVDEMLKQIARRAQQARVAGGRPPTAPALARLKAIGRSAARTD